MLARASIARPSVSGGRILDVGLHRIRSPTIRAATDRR